MSLATNKLVGLRELWAFDNRWQLLWQRLLFRKTGMTIYKMRGHEILVDHSAGDECGTRHCLVSDMYRKYLPLLNLSGEINVLDLGANGGGFPLMLLVEGVRIAKLVCVEMNPQTYTRALLNISRNFTCRYRVINAAVCGTNTMFEVWLGSGSTSDTLYQDPLDARPRSGKKCHVPGITLQDLSRVEFPIPEVVDLCKMDVEGAEYEILASDSSDFLKRVRYLIIEIHDRKGCEERMITGKLDRMGFTRVDMNSDGKSGVQLFRNGELIANHDQSPLLKNSRETQIQTT